MQYTALMFAAMSGSVSVVGSLLEAGAKPHATNKQGRTASQIAGFIGELCSHRVSHAKHTSCGTSHSVLLSLVCAVPTMPEVEGGGGFSISVCL